MLASVIDGGEILGEGVAGRETTPPQPQTSLQEAKAPAAKAAVELGWPHAELTHKAEYILT